MDWVTVHEGILEEGGHGVDVVLQAAAAQPTEDGSVPRMQYKCAVAQCVLLTLAISPMYSNMNDRAFRTPFWVFTAEIVAVAG